MTAKRSLFAELLDGVSSMKRHREGKITLRTHEVGQRPPPATDAGLMRETRERPNADNGGHRSRGKPKKQGRQ